MDTDTDTDPDMDTLELLYYIGSWSVISLTIISYIAFFLRFLCYRHSHYGLHMILLPNLAILIYFLSDAFQTETFWDNDLETQIIKTAASHFAMYSAAGFAIFNKMVLSAIRSPNFTQNFIKVNILVCILISTCFGLL